MKILILFLLVFSNLTMVFTQEIRGKVIDGSINSPLPYAKVFLIDIGSGTYTDSLGKFSFKGIFPKLLKINISASGYDDLVMELNFDSIKSPVFTLHKTHIKLDEVVVSGITGLQHYSITNVASKPLTELYAITTANLGEAISNIAGVYNNSTGNGISKPVIRGLGGMRVVTYLNNLRIENQQWGVDHGMGIGSLGIERVEVIKGPASLLYGADAIGGVIYFVDENYTDVNTIQTSINSEFQSNSMQVSNSFGLKLAKESLRLNLYGIYNSNADYQLPNGNYLKNSRFQEGQFKAALGYNRKNWVMNLRANVMNNEIGIPGEAEDSILSPEVFEETTQLRFTPMPLQKVRNSYVLFENKFFSKRGEFNISLGNTINHLQEIEENMGHAGMNVTLTNNTYNTKYRYRINEDVNLITGVQGMIQQNKNSREATEYLLPDAMTYDNGLYSVLTKNGKKWQYQAGLRFDNRIINTQKTSEFPKIFNGNYMSINYSAGFSRIEKKIRLRFNFSSGFRAPHITELLSDGVHEASKRYEVGDVNLKSEKAHQIDLSVETNSNHFSVIVNPFYNRVNNYILLNATDSVIEYLRVYQYTQAKKADLLGGELGLHYHPRFINRLHLETSYSYVYAKDEENNPLPFIPQAKINSILKYQLKAKSKFSIENIVVQHQYYFSQNRIAENEKGSSFYNLLNIGASIRWNTKNPLSIKFGVRNLLNESYIDHLSRLKSLGIFSPGINFYIGLKWKLQRNLEND